MKAEEVYDLALNWSKKYDKKLAQLLNKDKKYAIKIFSIERGKNKTRKDIVTWTDLRKEISYFFDELFTIDPQEIKFISTHLTTDELISITQKMKDSYGIKMNKTEWLENLKDISESLGYARNTKDFKENPDNFKGHLGDIARIYRVLLVGKNQSPDLYEVMKVLGYDKIKKRLNPTQNK